MDLGAYPPFNEIDNCYSSSNRPGYLIPSIEGLNMLTKRGDGRFTISELEVWKVFKV